jgi:Cysteine synthase
MHWKHATA